VRTNLNAQVTERVGRLLLQPAFAHPELAGLHPDEITKEALQRALSTSAELEYREQLRTGLLPASELAPQGMPAPRRAQLPGEILVQLGLRWVTAPHNTWFAPL
ncbi:MAG: hypothetical protein GWO16_10875, partial [Gammaproteobacteria bacterium]|nr:hypothetical protein [Gammaproteobacteria bacterium]